MTEPVVTPLTEADLTEADGLVRAAFGTGPDPADLGRDATAVRGRWAADPDGAFAARVDDRFAGVVFTARRGSVAYVGPLAVHPDLWTGGVGSALLGAALDRLRDVRHVGTFALPHNVHHVALQQRAGLWPRFLTAVMTVQVPASGGRAPALFADLREGARVDRLADCARLTGAVLDGFDLGREIRVAEDLGLGETVLIDGDDGFDGFAVCHLGAGTEAGSGTCYVKVGVARPGPGAEARFGRLLDACESLAAARGLPAVVAGVNTARHGAYRLMLARGYRTVVHGVALHRDDDAAHHRPDVWAVDDWR